METYLLPCKKQERSTTVAHTSMRKVTMGRLTTKCEGTEGLTVVERTAGAIGVGGGDGLQALAPC